VEPEVNRRPWNSIFRPGKILEHGFHFCLDFRVFPPILNIIIKFNHGEKITMPQRVLVIDDSKLVLAIASEALESAGYEVFATDSGIDANRYIYSLRRPDLILIDVMMPLLNGDRKVRLLKEREASRGIPVVLMSTKPREELAEIARKAGADGFLPKPFTGQSLLRQVRLLLTVEQGAA
jgi:CheY-like chemotaxis protein